jgi:pyruvate/2-oxoacid:ferredoxin oxidoreductase alpha subunit
LVASGWLGASLDREVARLTSRRDHVSAVKITAIRPFPGPRLVRTLSRVHVVVVVEAAASPLAQSHALAREVKAAFADALTWAPGYPGIGKIPRIVSVVSDHDGPSSDAIDAAISAAHRGHAATH